MVVLLGLLMQGNSHNQKLIFCGVSDSLPRGKIASLLIGHAEEFSGQYTSLVNGRKQGCVFEEPGQPEGDQGGVVLIQDVVKFLHRLKREIS